MVDPGETSEQAARRELREETGVELGELTSVLEAKSPKDGRPVHIYRASSWSGHAHPAELGTRIAWMSPRALFQQAKLYQPTLRQLRRIGALRPAKKAMTAMSDNTTPIAAESNKRQAARQARMRKRKGLDSKPDGRKPVGNSVHIRADVAPGGSIHVRHHMTNRAFYDGEGVQLSDEAKGAAPKFWNQIATMGAFAGHPAGPFKLDQKAFDEIIGNFKATRNRSIPVDYEHASEQDATSGSIPTSGAPAVGWITELKVEGDGLWGLFDWLEPARSQVREGKYKFLSPAIRFGAKDRVTGKPIGARMTSVALTNVPFLDGMQPLAAKDGGEGAAAPAAGAVIAARGLDSLVHQPHEYMPKVRSALGVHPLTSCSDCMGHLDRLRDCCMKAGPNGLHEGEDLSKYTTPLRDLVQCAPGDSWEMVFDRVEDMIGAAMDDEDGDGPSGAAALRDAAATATTTTTAEDDMTDQAILLREANDKVLAVTTERDTLATQLKDAKTALGAIEARIKELEPKLVQMKEVETQVADLKDTVTKQEEELKGLRTWKSERLESDVKADVEIAFDTYAEARQLKDVDKPHMLAMAKAAPEAFKAMYPFVKESERHLLRRKTPTEPRPIASQARAISLSTRAKEIVAEKAKSGIHITHSDAMILASAEV